MDWVNYYAQSSAAAKVTSTSSNITAATSTVDANAIIDTRPISAKGLLCIQGAKGRLNNLIIQVLVGLHMGLFMNRTLLVTRKVSEYYDIDELGRAFPEVSFLPVVLQNDIRCTKDNMITKIPKKMDIPGRYKYIDDQSKDWPNVTVDNNDIWYWLGRPPDYFYKRYFRALKPSPDIVSKVEAFLKERFGYTNPSINAVHLRSLEGKCNKFADDKSLCCPTRDYVTDVLKQRGLDPSLPLFIANDRQCSEKTQQSYSGDILGFQGSCQGTECAVIDFEICVRAQGFVGNLGSTGDMNIREWRTFRMGYPPSTSIVSLKKSTLDKEQKVEALSRYFNPGYWGWRKDCSTIAPKKRNLPCV